MTITLDLAPIAAFATANPWAALGLLFLLAVVLPGVWSRHSWRRRAALTLVQSVGDNIAAIFDAVRGAHHQ